MTVSLVLPTDSLNFKEAVYLDDEMSRRDASIPTENNPV
jgi:hypothetical protein